MGRVFEEQSGGEIKPPQDVVSGGGGRDRIGGEVEADILMGGRGRDRIHGGTGADAVYGAEGTTAPTPGTGHPGSTVACYITRV